MIPTYTVADGKEYTINLYDYNDKEKYKNYSRVVVGHDVFIENHVRLGLWCRENVTGEWKIFHSDSKYGRIIFLFVFENESDAIAFKLSAF